MADRELATALKTTPGFYPAEAAGGYLELARKDPDAAVERFDRALAMRADYVPALLGKGEALLRLDRESEAIGAFEGALAANPALPDVRRRVEVLKFQALERDLGAARQAARSGNSEEAVRLYRAAIAASPESPFLYRELGQVEVRRGESDAGLAHFRRAVELDPADAVSLGQIAQLLEAGGDLDAALAAYDTALAVEPNAALSARRAVVRERIELAKLPAQYHAIAETERITRADLAALIGVRLGPALRGGTRDGVVITDLRGSWAEPWINMVARAGIMDAFENHTFQPRELVDRAELAGAVTRILRRLASAAQARSWEEVRVSFTDIPPSHLAYPAAAMAVASGVMRTVNGAFQPSRPVSGAEASEIIERLRTMTPLAAPR
jgi:tetratricopeptide (TPR) repeat protein